MLILIFINQLSRFLSLRPQLQIKSIEASVIKRVVGVWIEQTKVESKQCLKNVIDNVGSIRAIHSINQAVAELGKCCEHAATVVEHFYQMF